MKRKKGLRWFRILAGMLLAALLYRAAAAESARVNERADITVIQMKARGLTAADAGEIQERELEAEEPLELNFWGEAGERTVTSRVNGKSEPVSLLYTGEKSGLVLPGTEILSWKENGCCLDKKTADALFGTEEAAGQTVWMGEKEYTVCGTFESFRKLVLCRARREDGAVLTAISCRVPKEDGAASRVQEFMMRQNLAGEVTDLTFLAYLSRNLMLLLPVCLGIRLLQMISRAISGAEETQTNGKRDTFALPLRCLRLILIVGICVFLWENIRIPSDMIPSRWSDFSFWGTWWETQKENLLRVFFMAQGETQVMFLWNFCRFVCASAGAVFCFLLCTDGA